jgi:hypothetical protein
MERLQGRLSLVWLCDSPSEQGCVRVNEGEWSFSPKVFIGEKTGTSNTRISKKMGTSKRDHRKIAEKWGTWTKNGNIEFNIESSPLLMPQNWSYYRLLSFIGFS